MNSVMNEEMGPKYEGLRGLPQTDPIVMQELLKNHHEKFIEMSEKDDRKLLRHKKEFKFICQLHHIWNYAFTKLSNDLMDEVEDVYISVLLFCKFSEARAFRDPAK